MIKPASETDVETGMKMDRDLNTAVSPEVRCLRQGKTPEQCMVSVIMPVYQCVDYLDETLASVLSQSLKDMEIICVDDGSADGSREKLLDIAGTDERMSVYQQSHLGAGAARNAGIERAAGKYLYFMDSDDLLVPGAMEKTVARAEEYSLDLLCFDADHFYDGSCTEKEFQYQPAYRRKHPYPVCTAGEQLFAAFCDHGEYNVSVWQYLYRRTLIMQNQIRFFSGIILEDNPFTYQVMIRAPRAGYLGEALYKRRIRPNSIMTTEQWRRRANGYAVAGNLIWKDYMLRRNMLSAEAGKWSVYQFNMLFQSSLKSYRRLPEAERAADPGEDDSPLQKLIAERVIMEDRYRKKLQEAGSLIQEKNRLLHEKDQELREKKQLLHEKDQELREKERLLHKREKELREIKDSKVYKLLLRLQEVYRFFKGSDPVRKV